MREGKEKFQNYNDKNIPPLNRTSIGEHFFEFLPHL